MKIALITTIFSLSHIGVYMIVREGALIPQDLNVYALWGALGFSFALGLSATANQGVENI